MVPGAIQEGVMSLEKVVPSVQVIVSLPFSKVSGNLSLHVTVRTTPESTGNVSDVVNWAQAGSNPKHLSVSDPVF